MFRVSTVDKAQKKRRKITFILQMVEDQNELLILLGELFYHESKFPHFLEALLLPGDLTESGLHTHTAQLANGEK